MSRPADWSAFGLGHDPVPGCPDTVENHARTYRDTAEHLENAARRLSRLGDSCHTKSDAVTKLMEKSAEVGTKLDRIACRYEEAGSALTIYAPVLRESQRKSMDAWNQASAASENLDRLRHQRNDVVQRWRSSAGGPESDAGFQSELNQVQTQQSQASGSLTAAKNLLVQAICERDTAANAAADRIEQGVESSGVNDSFWDKLDEAWRNFNKFMEEWGWVLDGLLIALSIALLFVPGGQVGTAALGAIRAARAAKLALEVVQTVSTVSQMVQDGVDGDWTAVALGGLTLLPLAAKGTKYLPKNVRDGRVGKFTARVFKPGSSAMRDSIPSAKKQLLATGKKNITQSWGGHITQALRRGGAQNLDEARLFGAAKALGDAGKRYNWAVYGGRAADLVADKVVDKVLATPGDLYQEHQQRMAAQK